MTHASLFSGIGGFDLAAEWMGWNNIFHCENNDFCNLVLDKHWPDVISYKDITATDFHVHRGGIDILTGGFPCQPYSLAGHRKGTEDPRHLWPHMLRAVREIQPRWVVGENVYGLVNWSGGLVFEQVQADLEAEGYEVQSFILPACGVNAPHKRERVWIVAHANFGVEHWRPADESGDGIRYGERSRGEEETDFPERLPAQGPPAHADCKGQSGIAVDETKGPGKLGIITDADFAGRCMLVGHETSTRRKNSEMAESGNVSNAEFAQGGAKPWNNFPAQSWIHRGGNGIPNRVDRIKALGNSVVPQVVLQIFKAIEQYEVTIVAKVADAGDLKSPGP